VALRVDELTRLTLETDGRAAQPEAAIGFRRRPLGIAQQGVSPSREGCDDDRKQCYREKSFQQVSGTLVSFSSDPRASEEARQAADLTSRRRGGPVNR
jgi:hypothetical protein